MEISPEFEWIWLGSLMVLTGIPHGATDHLVHWHKRESQGQSKNWWDFLVPYLLQMLLFALCWIFFPLLSFCAFLLISCYHFGQSELYYIQLGERNWTKKLLYVLWGALVLGIILLSKPEETIPYLTDILPASYLVPSIWSSLYLPLISLLSLGIFLGFLALWLKGKIGNLDFARELIVSILLCLTLHISSLWLGFGLYFGLWHATKAIRAELSVLKAEDKNWSLKDWIKQALPFSLVSFVGFALLIFLWHNWGQNWHPVFLFFVGISMLTLPHMTTLEHVYKSLK
ncbi:MAG: Brp/Blh family beta-carotene 15,15'-dioxygenase [Bacteroidota bacterium]